MDRRVTIDGREEHVQYEHDSSYNHFHRSQSGMFGVAQPVLWGTANCLCSKALELESTHSCVRSVSSVGKTQDCSDARKCVQNLQMLQNRLNLRQPNQDCAEECSKMRPNASKPYGLASAKSRLWPEMFENASTCFTTDRTCVNQIKRVIRNYRKCVQMLQIRSKLRQPNQDCGQKMRPHTSKPYGPASAKSRLWPQIVENAFK